MFVRKTRTIINGKTYTNHLLVESVRTPKGPRQRTICSLGSLSGRSAQDWLKLAARVEEALVGQEELFDDPDDPEVRRIVDTMRQRGASAATATKPRAATPTPASVVRVDSDGIAMEQPREAGPVYVGSTMYERMGIEQTLAEQGLSARTRRLARVMVLNRLVFPGSEYAMRAWVNRSALADLLGADFSALTHTRLYRAMDQLHTRREAIERALRGRERDLFGLEDTVFLYDLTSHYFEGQCRTNPQAQRGYSRDSRPDCKQVVVGLVVDREGFPIAHEVFDGNRRDSTTMEAMLDCLSTRVGALPGATVVVDRGISTDDNLAAIRARGCHYVVAARQSERDRWLEDIEKNEAFVEILRTPSPRNPHQKKSVVRVRRLGVDGEETLILCRGEGRVEKDRAIRARFEQKWNTDTEKLARRIAEGALVDGDKIHEAIGRLKERYPRVARYYDVSYDSQSRTLSVAQRQERKRTAEILDGVYILKTDRQDLSDEEAWRIYLLLTRAENAFRSMKSPLSERPIFHHLQHRVQTHIFLCVLAYHLLVGIEKMFLDSGQHTSWKTIRETLSTHLIATIVLPCTDGRTLRIRRATTPEEAHKRVYETLKMDPQIIKPGKTWTDEPERQM